MADPRSTSARSDSMFRAAVETSPYLYAVVRDDLILAYVDPAAALYAAKRAGKGQWRLMS